MSLLRYNIFPSAVLRYSHRSNERNKNHFIGFHIFFINFFGDTSFQEINTKKPTCLINYHFIPDQTILMSVSSFLHACPCLIGNLLGQKISIRYDEIDGRRKNVNLFYSHAFIILRCFNFECVCFWFRLTISRKNYFINPSQFMLIFFCKENFHE